MKKLVLILAVLSLSLSACAGAAATEAPPELTGEDIQATAVSMAWTMAAQTMAAMPTATFTFTPPPPTETPLPPTATLVPTLAVPTATNTAEASACSTIVSGWEGEATKLLFVNETKGDVTISLYLAEGSNPRGYCGNFYVPPLSKNQSTAISVPMRGVYYVYAWVSAKTNYSLSGGPFRTNNPDKHEIQIKEGQIKFVGP